MSFERVWHNAYVPGVPRELDFEKTTMSKALSRSAASYPDATALNFMGKLISYNELDQLVNSFARTLKELDVGPGDKVAMLLPNMPQAVIMTYAAFRLGAVAVPTNPLYTERELAYQLNDSDSKIAVSLDLLLPRIQKIQGDTQIETVITCHINDYLPFPKKQLFPLVKKTMYRKIEPQKGVYQFLDLIKKYPGTPLEDASSWDDVAALIYTGGTTGVSKGVMLTHANLSSNVQQFSAWVSLQAGESVVATYPFFHSAGFTALQHTSIWCGGNLILIPRPETEAILEVLKKFKPDYLPGVPTIFTGLLNSEEFRAMDLSFMKGFFAGAAPLPVDTYKQIQDLTGAHIHDVYGLTECSPVATVAPRGGKIKPGTVGLPIPSTDIRVVDKETGTNEVPQGEVGEILIKGPQVMKGYYNKPEETANVLKDGWLYTGDMGFLDPEGYLSIVDRKKDMIIASGFNVYPNEIDDILFSHPKIMEACVIGVPDEYRGETVKAYVVVKPGETLTEEAVIGYCKEKLTGYKVPKYVEFIDELPKSSVGKILRRELKAMDQQKVAELRSEM